MGGLALLARNMGHQVSGSDSNTYPPMSTLLAEHNVEVSTGYRATHLSPRPDLVVVGNALSRGNEEVEAMLEKRLPYTSGPEWLYANILKKRKVVAVAGTHGKTTTSAMLAHILDQCGLAPGFLIGGVPGNFGVSARHGSGDIFVVEADEYDTAFFDKRSKFVHYHPDVAVFNNLEFDHADIFNSIEDIEKQFHHLIRMVPPDGLLITNGDDPGLEHTLSAGYWTPIERFSCDTQSNCEWHLVHDGRHEQFRIMYRGEEHGTVNWRLIGTHNQTNALAAIAAANALGVSGASACATLTSFKLPERRLELVIQTPDGVQLYDDFAHHPTAIRVTLDALRVRAGRNRLIAIIEPRSNTMKQGHPLATLCHAIKAADIAIILRAAHLGWDPGSLAPHVEHTTLQVCDEVSDITETVMDQILPKDTIVTMSNGSFGGLRTQLLNRLRNRVKA